MIKQTRKIHHHMADNDDPDLLDKFSRYRFQEHDFLSQWKAIQKFVKYRNIGDYTYGDRHFTSARHLQESLDRVAIPALRSIFQPAEIESSSGGGDGGGGSVTVVATEDHDLIQLRRLVCAEMQDVIEGAVAASSRMSSSDEDDDQDETPGDVSAATSHWNPNQDAACSTKRGRKARTTDYSRSAISYDAGTDQYLKKKKQRKVVTTTASLSSNTNGTIASLVSSLKDTVSYAKRLDTSECEKIEAAYVRTEFERWKFLLYADHSLILYGNGSKRTIVGTFCDNELHEDGGILQVDAIDAEASALSIITLLSNLFHCASESASTLPHDEQAERVGKHIQKRCREAHDAVFLVIYNLECILQRNPADGKAIAKLSEYVRLLATVDDVDTPSYMNRCTSFVWIAVHTQRPYVRELAKLELSAEDHGRQSIRARQRELSESRIFEVLRNLAPRYAQVMEVLAKLQLQVPDVVVDNAAAVAAQEVGSGWVNYKDFREACKSNCLTDKQLRTLQTELKEHGLMIDKIDATGEFVRIPFGAEKLQAIQDFKQAKLSAKKTS